MINKQQVFLTAQKKEVPGKEFVSIEVEMPVDVFWKAEQIIRDTEYVHSNVADPLQLSELFKKLFTLLTPHALLEKDRAWLFERGQGDKFKV
jgi:hypothetical protein